MVTPIKTPESGQFFSYGAQEKTGVKRGFYKTDSGMWSLTVEAESGKGGRLLSEVF